MVGAYVHAAKRLVATRLLEVADPDKAAGMQAYMKTDMPFYGVQKDGRTPILRQLVKEFPPETADHYEALVRGLWGLPHREEKYLALGFARHFKPFITPDRLSLYRDLIVDGAWWDFVDEIATQLIRSLVISYPGAVWPIVDPWVHDDDMWLRRTAILCQVGAKEHTDPARLFRFCEACIGEREFFIRKAIGWALREYAKTDPDAVAGFINTHRGDLSGLSFREGSKHIKHLIR
ncbi:MAG TPA: DNA alkylation repair protein [Acidimicrobiia bacterium]